MDVPQTAGWPGRAGRVKAWKQQQTNTPTDIEGAPTLIHAAERMGNQSKVLANLSMCGASTHYSHRLSVEHWLLEVIVYRNYRRTNIGLPDLQTCAANTAILHKVPCGAWWRFGAAARPPARRGGGGIAVSWHEAPHVQLLLSATVVPRAFSSRSLSSTRCMTVRPAAV